MRTLRAVRILLFLATLPTIRPGAAQRLTAEQTQILETAREHAMAYTSRLPDFLCTQITTRSQAPQNNALSMMPGSRGAGFPQSPTAIPSDRIVETLTFLNQQENYKVVSINDKPAGAASHLDLGGAISAGEFGSVMRDIFSTYANTVFTWQSRSRLRNHKVLVFSYMVPQKSGIMVIGTRAYEQARVAYHGEIYLDEKTKEVVRLTSILALPPAFSITTAERSVDYEPVRIAERLFVLPLRSEITMESTGIRYHNAIDFKDYRKFTSEATLHYGGEVLQGAPQMAFEPVAQPSPAEVPQPTAATEPVPEAHPQTEPASVAAAPETTRPMTIATAQPAATPPSAPMPAPAPAPQPVEAPSARLHMDTDLVLVPVVLRAPDGHPVDSLKQENFELFDNGKRQTITSFTVERIAVTAYAKTPTRRFLVYLVDDVHAKAAELERIREVVRGSLNQLPFSDQAALITTSGLVEQSFTANHATLIEALGKLNTAPVAKPAEQHCPNLSEYTASQIVAQGESSYLVDNAMNETFTCAHLEQDRQSMQFSRDLARKTVLQTARTIVDEAAQRNRMAVTQLRDVVRWLAKAPEKRMLLFASPGFILNESQQNDLAHIADEALRAEIVLNTLDVHGLAPQNESGHFDDATASRITRAQNSSFDREASAANAEILLDLARGTGGNFLSGAKVLEAGVAPLTQQPELSYLIGFKPAKLKQDGHFHQLKVKIQSQEKLTVQARAGYFAPKP